MISLQHNLRFFSRIDRLILPRQKGCAMTGISVPSPSKPPSWRAPEDLSQASVGHVRDFFFRTPREALLAQASAVCQTFYGSRVFIRGLVEFSNVCTCNCLYCGIRAGNAQAHRYRLSEEEIRRTVRDAFAAGYRSFVLQSGEDPAFPPSRLVRLVEALREDLGASWALTLSCGILSREAYRDLARAGANRYLLRFETADPALHRHLRGGFSLEDRLRALRDLREEGYEVGSGYMVGLPGETPEIFLANALLCRELDLAMVGIGPFLPHPDTPLAGTAGGTAERTLEALALVRLLLPRANIPATTALATADASGRIQAYEAGANVVMVNITPSEAKRHYLLYPDKQGIAVDGVLALETQMRELARCGRTGSLERGDSLGRHDSPEGPRERKDRP